MTGTQTLEARSLPDFSKEQLLLTAEEAGDVLRIGRTTIYGLIKDRKIRPVYIGRSCRISRAELERFVEELYGSTSAHPTDPPVVTHRAQVH